eukprot:10641510-Ditylum_brightwellii.AAC.1
MEDLQNVAFQRAISTLEHTNDILEEEEDESTNNNNMVSNTKSEEEQTAKIEKSDTTLENVERIRNKNIKKM